MSLLSYIDDDCLVSLPGEEEEGGKIDGEIEDDESDAENNIGAQVNNLSRKWGKNVINDRNGWLFAV